MSRTIILARPGPSRVMFAIGFLGTAAIIYLMLSLRARVFDPSEVRIFLRLFLFQDYSAAFVFLGILLLGLIPRVQYWGRRLAEILGNHPVHVAALIGVLLALGALFGYVSHPLSMDEYAAVFQSEVFANRHLAGQFPAAQMDWLIPPYFQNVFFVVSHDSGQVASAYWPGFALLLTPFSLLDVAWLCNPVIGGLTVLALHRLAIDLFADRFAAGLVVLFTLASVAVTINAVSFYSMPAHLLMNALFAICILRRQLHFSFLAGLIGGIGLVLHNPFPHILFAGPWIIWLLFQPGGLRLFGALLLGYMPSSLLLGLGWSLFLQEIKADTATDVVTAHSASAISVIEQVLGSARRIFQLPSIPVLFARGIGVAKLWLWATPLLIPLAVWGGWRHRTNTPLMLLCVSALLTLLGYLFYPADQGHGWGFRYFHSAWFALPLLAVAGAVFNNSPEQQRSDLVGLMAGCALVSLVTMNLLRIYQVHGFIEDHKAQLPTSDRGTAVVQIVSTGMGYYAQDLVQNDPFLRNRPIIAITLGNEKNLLLLREHYPSLELLERSYRGAVWGVAKESE